MAEPVPRLYWDACVFLSYLEERPGRVADIQELLEHSEQGKLEIVTSVITTVEVAFSPVERTGQALDPTVEAAIDALWSDRLVVKLVEFHQQIAYKGRALIRNAIPNGWRLKPMDAIHLATAEWLATDRFHTYDDQLDKYDVLIGQPVERPQPDQLSLL
jgi:predicted nucleic acid-binding protein